MSAINTAPNNRTDRTDRTEHPTPRTAGGSKTTRAFPGRMSASCTRTRYSELLNREPLYAAIVLGLPCGTLTDFPSSLITTSFEGSGSTLPRATMESYPFEQRKERSWQGAVHIRRYNKLNTLVVPGEGRVKTARNIVIVSTTLVA